VLFILEFEQAIVVMSNILQVFVTNSKSVIDIRFMSVSVHVAGDVQWGF
jgi:hypothetical protein